VFVLKKCNFILSANRSYLTFRGLCDKGHIIGQIVPGHAMGHRFVLAKCMHSRAKLSSTGRQMGQFKP